MHYSYESWLRIWNPELFLILTRGLCLLPSYGSRRHGRCSSGFAIHRERPAAWPRLAMATPGPGLGRLQPAAAGARVPALPCRWRALEEGRGREGEPGRRRWVRGLQRRARGKRLASTLRAGRRRHAAAALSNVERALVHGGRVGISSSTWRAAK